jgi:hypothetical protein
MADIYSKATKVLVWLGPESEDSGRALFLLEYIASKVTYDWNMLQLSSTTDETHWADRTVQLPPLFEDEMPAIHHLIHRPWFERLWIRQEVQLASRDIELMCGQRVFLWKSLCTAIACLDDKPVPTFEHTQAFCNRLRFVYHLCDAQKETDLQGLIYATQYCVCSDPRDKIYALLPLLPPWMSGEIEPDYTKSVQEVYRDATLHFIQTSPQHNLEFLTTIKSHNQSKKVPLWVPDVCLISFYTLSLTEPKAGSPALFYHW